MRTAIPCAESSNEMTTSHCDPQRTQVSSPITSNYLVGKGSPLNESRIISGLCYTVLREIFIKQQFAQTDMILETSVLASGNRNTPQQACRLLARPQTRYSRQTPFWRL